jgi:glycosyltransferase involved in cell wall biosynthesis
MDRKIDFVSFIVPTFNEELNIEICLHQIENFCKKEHIEYEIIVIDNRSTDETVPILEKLCKVNKRIKVIINSKNFGPHNSPYYGLLQASGTVVVPMVADMQTPINSVKDFIGEWEKGADVVLGVRSTSSENFGKKLTQKIFYQVMTAVSTDQYQSNFIGYGLYDRKIVEILRNLDDPTPFFRGLVQRIGFTKAIVQYSEPKRFRGRSKQKFRDKIEYTLLGITSLGFKPVLYSVVTGAIFFWFALLVSAFAILTNFADADKLGGNQDLLLLFLIIIGGIQFLCLSLTTIYAYNILNFTRKGPLVIEDRRINFSVQN